MSKKSILIVGCGLLFLLLDQSLNWLISHYYPSWLASVDARFLALPKIIIYISLVFLYYLNQKSRGLTLALFGAISNQVTIIFWNRPLDYLPFWFFVTNLADGAIIVGLIFYLVETFKASFKY